MIKKITLVLLFLISLLPVQAAITAKPIGFLQYKYTDADNGDPVWAVKRARIGLAGSLSDTLSYNVAYGAKEGSDQDPHVVQAFIDWTPKEDTSVRVGQFFVPFGLEGPRAITAHSAIERSYATRKLNPFSIFRDTGVQFQTKSNNLTFIGAILSGAGANQQDTNQSKDIVTRVIYSPTAALQFGTSAHRGKYHSSGQNLNRNRYGIDFSYTKMAHLFQGEYITRTDETTSSTDLTTNGWYLLYDYHFTQAFDGVLRYENYDDGTSNPLTKITTVGMNYHFQKRYRLSANYEFVNDDAPISNQLTAQFQMTL